MGRYLYVRNISLEATEEDLKRLFAVAGTVVSIHLTKDRVSGQFNGCSFIKMKNEKEAKEAINCLDEARFMDQELMVEEARDQKKEGAGQAEIQTRQPRQSKQTARGKSTPARDGRKPSTGGRNKPPGKRR